MNFIASVLFAAATWLNATSADIPAVAQSLPDDAAIRILVSVGGPGAERALANALASADDTNAVKLIKALGDLGSSEAISDCARRLLYATGDLKDVCLYALGRTTSRRAARLLSARISDGAYAAAYLRHGESLLELGRKQEPAVVALDLLGSVKSSPIRCGAVALLAAARGYAAQPKLLALLDDPDRAVREQAARQLSQMPSAVGLIAAFRRATGEPRRLLLEAIARRAEPANVPVLLEALRESDDAVRQVAVLALQNSVDPKVDAALAGMLTSPAQQGIALELLTRRRARAQAAAVMPLIHDPAVSKQAFTALGLLAGEKEIEQILSAALATNDEGFREQAAKAIAAAAPRLANNTRVVAMLTHVPESARAWTLSLLPAFGGKTALDAVVAASRGSEREAAVRALADWRDESALEPLLALCRESEDTKLRVLAARGAIRIVTRADLEKEQKAAWLQKLIETAPRPEEKQQAQAALQELEKQPGTLRRKK